MKKLLLFLVLIITINVSAQSTTWFSKPLELETVPASTSKSDSVLVRGTDKIVKYLPISKIKSITNLDYLATPTGGTVFSSSGNDASVPLATTVNAGLQSPVDKSKINGLDVALAIKVDKVAGKGLSTEDYTTVEKNKLAGVQNGATANSTDAQLRDRSTHTGTQAISTVISLQAALDAKINLSMVGANNGVAPLDAGGKIPFAYLPASLMIYKGMWNPATNTPNLSDGTGVAGWVYKVNVGGTINLGSGNITLVASDFVIHNGTKWEVSKATDAVVSVNGQQGIVTLNKNDVGLGNVDNTADLSKPISTATQTALNLKANLAGGNTFTGNNSFHLGTVSVAEPTLSHNPTTRNYVDSNFQLKISNPITGTGTTKYFPVFNGASTVMSSSMFEESNRVAISAKPLLVTAGYGIGFQLEDGFKITREIGHTAFSYNNIPVVRLHDYGFNFPNLVGSSRQVAVIEPSGKMSSSALYVSVSTGLIKNRIVKTNSETDKTISVSQIYDDGLKVGIGTDAPNARLDINDTNGGTFFDGSNANYNRWKSYGASGAVGKPLLISAQSSGTTPDIHIKDSGEVSIGSTLATGKLNVFTGLSGNSFDLANQQSGGFSFSNAASSTSAPTMSAKTDTNGGLFLISGTPNTNNTADINFGVRRSDNTDFTNLTNTAFRFNRFNTVLVDILRNGDATFTGSIKAKPATLPTELVTLGQVSGYVPASGTYTPVTSALTNISSQTMNVSTYTKIGNIVNVSVGMLLTPTTTNTNTSLEISLPINRITLTSAFIGSGALKSFSTPNSLMPVTVQTSGTDKVLIYFVSPATGSLNTTGAINFQYSIN
ncbi:hypothetical protein LPB87_15025 [Flavobacterium sp. EDS]|uniref:hypothetical protein n=1 Tax=Flavobacterium sp. EDS TaxID=2897328 RepID=UPI001E4B1AA7|nr:hypothetical protein [Flavobacterium sp. EDS]MCD0475709.1 hypothetical protein [Flavobacterium sp. EDS]